MRERMCVCESNRKKIGEEETGKKENSIPVHTIEAAIEMKKNLYTHRRSDDNNNKPCKILIHNKEEKISTHTHTER